MKFGGTGERLLEVEFWGTEAEVETLAAAITLAVLSIRDGDARKRPCGCKG